MVQDSFSLSPRNHRACIWRRKMRGRYLSAPSAHCSSQDVGKREAAWTSIGIIKPICLQCKHAMPSRFLQRWQRGWFCVGSLCKLKVCPESFTLHIACPNQGGKWYLLQRSDIKSPLVCLLQFILKALLFSRLE